MQKRLEPADDYPVPRRARLGSAVFALVALSLFFVACGTDDAATEPDNQGTEAAGDRGLVEGQPREATAMGREALDEAADRFASTVGDDYVLTFDFVSSSTAEAGAIRVEVVGGRATDVTYPDAMSEMILPQIPMLTISDFYERARSVLADGGLVEIEFDATYGYPALMTIDPIPDAIDDEMSVVVRSVEPTEKSPETDGY